MCGIAPFDRSVSARRQSREKREEEQRRQRHIQTSRSAPAKAGVQSTRTYQEARNLENKLKQVVLEKDFAVANRITRGVVQHDDGQREEISQEEYAAFKAYQAKEEERKREDAISTQGQLLSHPKWAPKLKEKANKRRARLEAEASKEQRKEERIVARVEKQMKT
eukprot:SAG11_NODE_3662_length_2301_cov_3.291099_3_plen_165_part_00